MNAANERSTTSAILLSGIKGPNKQEKLNGRYYMDVSSNQKNPIYSRTLSNNETLYVYRHKTQWFVGDINQMKLRNIDVCRARTSSSSSSSQDFSDPSGLQWDVLVDPDKNTWSTVNSSKTTSYVSKKIVIRGFKNVSYMDGMYEKEDTMVYRNRENRLFLFRRCGLWMISNEASFKNKTSTSCLAHSVKQTTQDQPFGLTWQAIFKGNFVMAPGVKVEEAGSPGKVKVEEGVVKVVKVEVLEKNKVVPPCDDDGDDTKTEPEEEKESKETK